MAARTERRNIRGERRRTRAQFPHHSVRAMAFLARWAVGVVLRDELAMRADGKLLTHFGMTRRTVNFLRDRFARPEMGDAHFRMALTARGLRVARISKVFLPDGKRTAVP